MRNDSWFHYLSIRATILLLQAIGPACLLVTATAIIRSWPEWPLQSWLLIWPAAESIWYLFFLWYRNFLQADAIHPPLRSAKDRRAFFDKVRSEVYNPEAFLSGWFRGAKMEDIGREELRSFINWAFWDGRASSAGDATELELYTDKVEKMMQRDFCQGNGAAKSLQLTLDPIVMECRTIFWYYLIGVVDTVAHLLLRLRFQYYKTAASSLWIVPARPATWFERRTSAAKNLSYWLKPHTAKDRLPIVYIHGIGIGLLPNVRFLAQLDESLNAGADDSVNGQVGILVLEILQISSRITTPIINRPTFLAQIRQVLEQAGFDQFVLASHSYGSVLATHMLDDPLLAPRISATLFVDPVTMLLHMPDVAYNFTVRPPKATNEWVLWYFASKDPGVAHTLGRHFFWTENVLWRDRIVDLVGKGMRMTASLASCDLIVDTASVGEYLMEQPIPYRTANHEKTPKRRCGSTPNDAIQSVDWRKRPWTGEGVEVLWWDDMDHGQVFDDIETRGALVRVLVEYTHPVR